MNNKIDSNVNDENVLYKLYVRFYSNMSIKVVNDKQVSFMVSPTLVTRFPRNIYIYIYMAFLSGQWPVISQMHKRLYRDWTG